MPHGVDRGADEAAALTSGREQGRLPTIANRQKVVMTHLPPESQDPRSPICRFCHTSR